MAITKVIRRISFTVSSDQNGNFSQISINAEIGTNDGSCFGVVDTQSFVPPANAITAINNFLGAIATHVNNVAGTTGFIGN